MRPYVAVEIDGVLSPHGGPLPAGYTVHEAESAAWQGWAAMVYPRPRGLRLALNAEVGRALMDLPADLVLVSSYTPGELEPLLPALGWETVPPLVPMRHTATIHYMRVEDPGRSPDAAAGLHWRAEEIRRTTAYLSTVGPVLAHAVNPAAGITAAGLQALREWARGCWPGRGRTRWPFSSVRCSAGPCRSCSQRPSRPAARLARVRLHAHW
ncbi:hypothetical protein ACIA74_44595 [Streptomyces sp. NPDC051658]|uniref:hypothetical protein n=1 Tax=Streptomyces sp. NPDC051658 TaxID=3365667 RepID=UPI002F9082D8